MKFLPRITPKYGIANDIPFCINLEQRRDKRARIQKPPQEVMA